jgi:hypothetical protein
MAYERLRNGTLPHALSAVVADTADLFQKELLLAKAEMSSRISTKLSGGLWLGAAVVLSLMVVFILLQALIFAIESYGFAMHWACLMVAGFVAVIAVGAFLKGRANAQTNLVPQRAIDQIKRDIATAKEQLT